MRLMHTYALFMYLPIQCDRPRHASHFAVSRVLTSCEACACTACLSDEAPPAGRSRSLLYQLIAQMYGYVFVCYRVDRRTERLHTLEQGCAVHEQLNVSS